MEVITCLDINGHRLKKGTLVNGSGTIHYYDKSGELIRTIKYENGIPNNICQQWL